MTTGDLVYNLLLVAVVAATVAWVRRVPGALVLALGFLLGLAAAVASVLAWPFFSGDMFAVLRLFAWGVFVHLPLALLLLAGIEWRRRRAVAILSLAGALALAAVAVDAFWIEPHDLEVTRVRLTSSRVEKPLRIVLLADLQTDAVGDYERGVLAAAVAERPDLVLLAGDYVQSADPAEYAALGAAFGRLIREVGLQAPLGVFAVEGNTDWRDRWRRMFDGTAVTARAGTTRFAVGPVTLTLLSVGDSFNTRLAVASRRGFHIVLGHAPDFARGEVAADLLLAGHTHGGQVRLPLLGPLLTLSSVPRSWAAGTTALPGGRTLVVSRGIGMERGGAPRLRFLCRPELVVIEVLPESGGEGRAGEATAP